jgi:hypothetical protein
MGRKSKPPPPPAAPTTQQASGAAEQTAQGNFANALAALGANRWNEQGPDGSVSWSLRQGVDPAKAQPGDYIRSTTLSPEQEALRQQSAGLSSQFGGWAEDALGAFGPDDEARSRLTDSLYRRNTQYFDRRFGVSQNALESKLANSGLARGSEAWNNELARFNEDKNQAYADATDRAVIGGEQQSQANQQNSFNRILSAMTAMRGGMTAGPQSANTGAMANVPGADYLGAMNGNYNQQLSQYNAQLGATNAQNASRMAPWNALAGLGSSALLGGLFGGGR